MILSDITIKERISNGDIKITPEVEDEQYQSTSIDLRLGDSYYNKNDDQLHEDSYLIEFKPQKFYLAHTLETIEIPDNLSAEISGRGSLARKGLIIFPVNVDPGFRGQITLQVFNLSQKPISFPPQKRIAQIKFEQVDQPVEQPYGETTGAKYQNQEGPTQSRMDELSE